MHQNSFKKFRHGQLNKSTLYRHSLESQSVNGYDKKNGFIFCGHIAGKNFRLANRIFSEEIFFRIVYDTFGREHDAIIIHKSKLVDATKNFHFAKERA